MFKAFVRWLRAQDFDRGRGDVKLSATLSNGRMVTVGYLDSGQAARIRTLTEQLAEARVELALIDKALAFHMIPAVGLHCKGLSTAERVTFALRAKVLSEKAVERQRMTIDVLRGKEQAQPSLTT